MFKVLLFQFFFLFFSCYFCFSQTITEKIEETLHNSNDILFVYEIEKRESAMDYADTLNIHYVIKWTFGVKDGYVNFSDVISQSIRIFGIKSKKTKKRYGYIYTGYNIESDSIDNSEGPLGQYIISELLEYIKRKLKPIKVYSSMKIKCDEKEYKWASFYTNDIVILNHHTIIP